jgi:hypothetical protein
MDRPRFHEHSSHCGSHDEMSVSRGLRRLRGFMKVRLAGLWSLILWTAVIVAGREFAYHL